MTDRRPDPEQGAPERQIEAWKQALKHKAEGDEGHPCPPVTRRGLEKLPRDFRPRFGQGFASSRSLKDRTDHATRT